MFASDSVIAVMTAPTPASLRRLHVDLLQAGVTPGLSIWETLERFHDFINDVSARMDAHEYSKLATLLDIGAVGGVALESVVTGEVTTSDLWKRLLMGAVSESLMVLASRQYVKAFEVETSAVFDSAAWYLVHQYWQVSITLQPAMSADRRRSAIEQMLAPANDGSVANMAKAVLIGRLFQVLLLLQIKTLSENPTD